MDTDMNVSRIEICKLDGSKIPYSAMDFSGGERHIQLKDLTPLETRELCIRARVRSTSDLLDLLLIENALREEFGKDITINLEIPYLPYSRQDRVCAPGQAFSLQVMANLLKTMNINKLVTWDCHSAIGSELVSAINVEAADIISANSDLQDLLKAPDTVLVCPDKGAVNRCQKIQNSLGLKDLIFCEKQRDPATGMIKETRVLADDLTGKRAIISDDICDGGFTFIKIAEQLRAKQVEQIILFVTHGIFSKGIEVFDNLIDRVITTTSFPQKTSAKLNVINFEYNFGE